ncbi:hypothetical protein FQN51_005024 [Onygenales sp. PD_10]|nr:hypothetical protein FQN51_005024 [Onygenales sp. PD_10]
METGLHNEERRSHGESEDASNRSYFAAAADKSSDVPKKNSGDFLAHSQSLRVDNSLILMNENSPGPPPPYNNDHPATFSSCFYHSTPYAPAMFIPAELGLSPEDTWLLRNAKPSPPVTKETLSELDLDSITLNTQLRVDVSFDRDLHFRPVNSPEKLKMANLYWEAIAKEILIYSFYTSNNISFSLHANLSTSSHGDKQFTPRLPTMLRTLKDILLTLVPDRDHPCVTENLDIPFLVQQIEKGVLNLVSLAEWLSSLLKTHCAPMRDQMVDEMVDEIRSGCGLQDMGKLAEGLHSLFTVLEAMKLDVANHQIRALRMILIEQSVDYLREHVSDRRKKSPKFEKEVRATNLRYLEYRHRVVGDFYSSPVPNNLQSMQILLRYLFDEVFFSTNPPKESCGAFILDFNRLCDVQEHIEILIILEICRRVFEKVMGALGGNLSPDPATYATLQSRVLSIIEHADNSMIKDDSVTARFKYNRNYIALEIARVAQMIQANSYGLATTYPDNVAISYTLAQLATSVEEPEFTEASGHVKQRLLQATTEFVNRYWSMSPLQVADSQHMRQQSDNIPVPQIPDIECLGKRLAHITVLHWRIWAPILYSAEEGKSPDRAQNYAPVPNVFGMESVLCSSAAF